MNKETYPKMKWLIFFILIFLIIVLIGGYTLWNECLKTEIQSNELGRMGWISIDHKPSIEENITIKRVDWIDYFENPKKYKIDLLIIGDSFSNQGKLPEYMATYNEIEVLALRIQEIQPVKKYSPINLLIALDNSGMIDEINPDYVLLESVPRLIHSRSQNVDFNSNITREEIIKALNIYYAVNKEEIAGNHTAETLSAPEEQIDKEKKYINSTNTKLMGNNLPIWETIFSNNYLNFHDPIDSIFNQISDSLLNIRQVIMSSFWLFFTDHTAPIKGQPYTTYRMQLDESLFSSQSDGDYIYFLSDDLSYQEYLNETGWLYQYNIYLNILANRLQKKNISFIFMPSIDKFDFYYSRITNNPYPENPFFKLFESQNKFYTYINSKDILKSKLDNNEKELFLHGDSHWSWRSVEYLASQIPLGSKIQDFSFTDIGDSIPSDPEIMKLCADAFSKGEEYEYASDLYMHSYKLETGNSVLSIQLLDDDNNLNYGIIDGFIEDEDCYHLYGWAINPINYKPARYIVITDKNNRFVAICSDLTKRPGLVRYYNNNDFLISGWDARILKNDLSPESFPLKAYVVVSEENKGYPLPGNKRIINEMNKVRANLSDF